MPQNDFNDGILDPLEADDASGSRNDYVPKFERDLKEMGSLEALSAAKKAETEDPDSISLGDGDIDLSSLRPESDYEAKLAEQESNVEFVSPENDYSYSDADEGLMTLKAYSDTEQQTASAVTAEERSAPKSFADFAREAEEAEKEEEEAVDHNLDGIDVSSALLSDMDYDDNKDKSHSLMKQMQMDELAMEMENRPLTKDMSDKFKPTKKRAEDVLQKDVLDSEDKQILKERLEKEIGRKPEGYKNKTSLEMYHSLMEEQKIKKAKKGFFVVLMLVAMGMITAVITYFKLNWDGNKYSQLFMYLPISIGSFSLMLLLKAKPAKIISQIYFFINAIILIVPGFIKFAIETAHDQKQFVMTLIFYIIAIALNIFVFIVLCTSDKVEAYYTTQLLSSKKKAFDERKSKYRQ